ncbi:carbohydrate ABC transporter permease [Pseudactinotalea suaedae]|uniref:carbohydrate ABC transporter permease n=1 Tax=Pseudactinotalea suaedae TaxID=1524924 RepID=UPI001F4F4A5F|nr:carbohydrate ABC transporter permease [Pseudactinotalea suaedae]
MATETPTLPAGAEPISARGRKDELGSSSARGRRRRTNVLIWGVLAVVSLVMAAPFIWMFLTSFRTQEELGMADMPLLPSSWRWDNYLEALDAAPFATYARNSLLLAMGQATTAVVIGSMCGYALAKLRWKASGPIFGWFLLSLMVPFYATVIPAFFIVRYMPLFGGNNILGQGGTGWIDTWWALIVPAAISPFLVFLFRQFYVGTPTELIEAARIDGVGEFGIFARIITPLIKPGLLTVALLAFEAGWNNFLWPLLVTSSQDLRVIQVGISVFRQESATQFHLLMAGTTMAAVPMIVLFVVFQRYFVNGFVSSGIK